MLYVVAHLLILAPLFVHGSVDQWQWSIHLSWVGMSVLLAVASRTQHPMTTLLLMAAIWTIVVLVAHEYVVLPVLIAASVPLTFALTQWDKTTRIKSFYHFSGLIIVMLSTLIASIYLHSTLDISFHDGPFFDYHALMLGFWWIFPSALVTWLLKLPREGSRVRIGFIVLAFWLVTLAVGKLNPSCLFTLNTLCAVTGVVLVSIRLLKAPRLQILRRSLFLGALIGCIFAFGNLAPVLDSNRVPDDPMPAAPEQSSRFQEFYRLWLKVRGDTEEDSGPIFLLAASGGGLRAAAHAGMSFAAIDDMTNGKFGDRVLAVSGVSGGALGAVSWLAQRSEGQAVAGTSQRDAQSDYPRLNRQRRFYSSDFVTPMANSLLIHDIPLAIMPIIVGGSSRDQVLAGAWNDAWNRSEFKTIPPYSDKGLFQRSVKSLEQDRGSFPMLVINTTSAHDGARAVYSSVEARFPGAWRLDPSAKLAKAVSDSARFAFVSPVGQACADADPHTPQGDGQSKSCPSGYFPLAVADGGYQDNSGLDSIVDILDELQRVRGNLKNVFVFIVKSNPSENLALRKGTIFDNGRLIAELLAPGYVLDAARSGHSATFEKLIRERLPNSHVITWDMSYAYLAKALARPQQLDAEYPWPAYFHKRAAEAVFLKSLNLPPLGWTLDPRSFDGIDFAARTHSGLEITTDCTKLKSGASLICREISNSNSLSRK
ncbi:putative membrane protein [Collimonas arenae]|nr:putative membrane protein [Collimonas arenae]